MDAVPGARRHDRRGGPIFVDAVRLAGPRRVPRPHQTALTENAAAEDGAGEARAGAR